MIDLSVNFAGMRFKNPFLISGSPVSNPYVGNIKKGAFEKAARAGWAGSIMRIATYSSSFLDLAGYAHWLSVPRETKFVDIANKSGSPFFAMENITLLEKGLTSNKDVVPIGTERVMKEAKEEVKDYPGFLIGFDIGATQNPEDWVKIAKVGERAGADFLTLNLSCPTHPPETEGKKTGIFVGVMPDLVRKIVSAVKKNSSLPVIPKLTPNIPTATYQAVAKACEEGGADGICAGNTILGFSGVDIDSKEPLSVYEDVDGKLRGGISGIGGPALRLVEMRCVAEAYQTIKIPISANGGGFSWEHAVEYILLGASTVQFCTYPMFKGYSVVKELIQGLTEYMSNHGYNSIEDFRGYTSRKYGVGLPWTEPKVIQPWKMEVNEHLCSGCGFCVRTCEASARSAMKVVEHMAKIDQELCIQCGMCKLVCPVGAIMRKPTKAGVYVP